MKMNSKSLSTQLPDLLPGPHASLPVRQGHAFYPFSSGGGRSPRSSSGGGVPSSSCSSEVWGGCGSGPRTLTGQKLKVLRCKHEGIFQGIIS